MTHILHESPDCFDEIGEPITADVFRFDPQKDAQPGMQRYIVAYYHRLSVFTLLREIYERQDPTLAFRNQQCGRGICGSCRIKVGVNGRIMKGCTIPLKPGDHVVIEPSHREKVIRDLVVES